MITPQVVEIGDETGTSYALVLNKDELQFVKDLLGIVSVRNKLSHTIYRELVPSLLPKVNRFLTSGRIPLACILVEGDEIPPP
jgi:hypothetical protein